MAWMSKNGPFWDDERQSNADDYFEFDGIDVTDAGLGEAARRILAGNEVTTYSFSRPDKRFSFSPLAVMHGLPEAPINTVCFENIWEICRLEQAFENSTPPPSDWSDMTQRLRAKFVNLLIPDGAVNTLKPQPFALHTAGKIEHLLRILDEFVSSRKDGQNTNESQKILDNFFTGKRALFTDESNTNKAKFKRQLEFTDPDNPESKIFCPFHGKVSSPAYRIHFKWPMKANDNCIKVLYIGPKITKT